MEKEQIEALWKQWSELKDEWQKDTIARCLFARWFGAAQAHTSVDSARMFAEVAHELIWWAEYRAKQDETQPETANA